MADKKDAVSLEQEDTYATCIPENCKKYAKSKLIDCLTDADDYSLSIVHDNAFHAQMVVELGSEQGVTLSACGVRTNSVLIRNIPQSCDEEYIQMFFEYTKGQGGGPVKYVSMDYRNSEALVVFESASSVAKVLMKQPISMMGTKVDIEMYDNLLESYESLSSAKIVGLDKCFDKELIQSCQDMRYLDGRTAAEKKLENNIKDLKAFLLLHMLFDYVFLCIIVIGGLCFGLICAALFIILYVVFSLISFAAVMTCYDNYLFIFDPTEDAFRKYCMFLVNTSRSLYLCFNQ